MAIYRTQMEPQPSPELTCRQEGLGAVSSILISEGLLLGYLWEPQASSLAATFALWKQTT